MFDPTNSESEECIYRAARLVRDYALSVPDYDNDHIYSQLEVFNDAEFVMSKVPQDQRNWLYSHMFHLLPSLSSTEMTVIKTALEYLDHASSTSHLLGFYAAGPFHETKSPVLLTSSPPASNSNSPFSWQTMPLKHSYLQCQYLSRPSTYVTLLCCCHYFPKYVTNSLMICYSKSPHHLQVSYRNMTPQLPSLVVFYSR